MSARGAEGREGEEARVGVREGGARTGGTGTKAPARGKVPAGGVRAETDRSYGWVRGAMADYPLWARAFRAFAFGLVYYLCKLLFPWRIEREDELVGHLRERGCMVVGNHVSMLEPVLFITRMWRRGIRVRPIYKIDFEKIGPAKWFFRRMGGIPIDRGSADLGAIRAAKDALVRGECILVYPEGTRVKNDEQKVELHGGFAMIAQMAKAPVVPTAVVGAADPYHTRPTRRRHPVFAAGEPIIFASLGVTGRKAQMAEMERVAMGRVYELRDGLRKECPGLW